MDWSNGGFILSTIIVAGGIIGIVGMIILFMSAAEKTEGSQLERLRTEYLGLLRQYESRYDDYDCGHTLAEHIDVTLSEWGRRMREIAVEVETIIKEERER